LPSAALFVRFRWSGARLRPRPFHLASVRGRLRRDADLPQEKHHQYFKKKV